MGNTALPLVGDADLQRLTQLIEDALNALEAKPLNGGVIITQAFTTADNRVYHGLGRPAQGYLIVRKSFAVDIFEGAVPETVDPGNYVTLRASAGGAGNISVLVF